MAVTLYQSTDPSAPVLNGTAGEFVALLKACLVDGYGTKAAAGWTRPFSGTNKAAFRQGGGNQFYWRVEDNFSDGTGFFAKTRGGESMSDVDTFTNAFPTTAQVTDGAGAIFIHYNAGSVARPWLVLADNKTCYVFTDIADNDNWRGIMYGDVASYVAADGFRTMLIGSTSLDKLASAISSTLADHYIARAYTGTGTSLLVGKHGDFAKQASGGKTLGVLPYPNPADTSIHISPVYVHEIASPLVRAKLRGFWHWLHNTTGIGAGDTFTGTGELAGKTFLLLLTSENSGVYCLEISNTWPS